MTDPRHLHRPVWPQAAGETKRIAETGRLGHPGLSPDPARRVIAAERAAAPAIERRPVLGDHAAVELERDPVLGDEDARPAVHLPVPDPEVELAVNGVGAGVVFIAVLVSARGSGEQECSGDERKEHRTHLGMRIARGMRASAGSDCMACPGRKWAGDEPRNGEPTRAQEGRDEARGRGSERTETYCPGQSSTLTKGSPGP